MANDMTTNMNEIITYYLKNHPGKQTNGLYQAYHFAALKHGKTKRISGELYIFHPLRVAKMVAKWRLDGEVIMAALLHDVVEDCQVPLEEIRERFGIQVAELVNAVTNLSDKEFADPNLTKEEKDQIRDVLMQKKMNEKALYVKIADRIDNLSHTMGVPEDKCIRKAAHTREIIIPMVKMINAYHLVDVLEELCFKLEKPQIYKMMMRHYRELLLYNQRKCLESIQVLSKVFDPATNNESKELEWMHGYLAGFHYEKRACISIYRKISREAINFFDEWKTLFSKKNIALFDLVLVVSDRFLVNKSYLSPNDVFFEYFDKALRDKGFYLMEWCQTTKSEKSFFLISDEMDNKFRLFVRSEHSYDRYFYGDIVDGVSSFTLPEVNENDPRDTYTEKIRVFCEDGKYMMIDKGATVLDFAFHIHSELGYHFDHARLNNSRAHYPAYTRLNEGDVVTIVENKDRMPTIASFRYVKTSKAVDYLIRYFTSKNGPKADQGGNQVESQGENQGESQEDEKPWQDKGKATGQEEGA